MNEFEMKRKVRCHKIGLWKFWEIRCLAPSAWRQPTKVKITRGLESRFPRFAKNAK